MKRLTLLSTAGWGLFVIAGVSVFTGCDLGTYNDRMTNPVEPVDADSAGDPSGARDAESE